MNFTFILGLSITLIMLIGLLFIFLYQKKKNKIKQSNKSIDTKNYLLQIQKELEKTKTLHLFDKKITQQLQKDIDESLHQLFKGRAVNISNLEQRFHSLYSRYNQFSEDKQQLLSKCESFIQELHEYVNSHSFFPSTLLFDSLKLEEKIAEAKNDNNKTFQPEYTEKLHITYQNIHQDFQTFLDLIDKTTSIIQDDNLHIHANDKQRLFFHIQNGEFKDAYQLLHQWGID